MRRTKLFSFSDCGFIALNENKSAESFICVAAIPLDRDGSIQLKGMILDFATHKIAPAARSTLRAEAVALANALGNSIWLRPMLLEMVFRRVPALHLNSTDGSQLSSPFDHSFARATSCKSDDASFANPLISTPRRFGSSLSVRDSEQDLSFDVSSKPTPWPKRGASVGKKADGSVGGFPAVVRKDHLCRRQRIRSPGGFPAVVHTDHRPCPQWASSPDGFPAVFRKDSRRITPTSWPKRGAFLGKKVDASSDGIHIVGHENSAHICSSAGAPLVSQLKNSAHICSSEGVPFVSQDSIHSRVSDANLGNIGSLSEGVPSVSHLCSVIGSSDSLPEAHRMRLQSITESVPPLMPHPVLKLDTLITDVTRLTRGSLLLFLAVLGVDPTRFYVSLTFNTRFWPRPTFPPGSPIFDGGQSY